MSNSITTVNDEKKKFSIPEMVHHFLTVEDDEKLIEKVEEYNNFATYNIQQGDFNSRTVLSSMKDVNQMLQDPICQACVANVMDSTFQTDNDNNVFKVQTPITAIEKELNKFHEEIDAQNLVLTIGYNTLLWGQLPLKHCFNKDGVLERIIPIPDFTQVTPIIISGRTIGFMYENEFHPSYEFTYAQSSFYKNLGGNTSNQWLTLTNQDNEMLDIKNEFCYAHSYLSSASKPWRNVQIIEDALLLNRMDQSNYYRLIKVNVGGQVYSKPAIQTLNYYRNLFKKVRRVSYDSSGMASRGVGQEFEVIIPSSSNEGVDVTSVGGEVDVKALKDLDVQYQRLFASLRTQPSMIGFSEDVPSTLGEGPVSNWDKRFAKLCKNYSFSTFNALRRIDYFHLRSLGYNVNLNDWKYGTVSTTLQDDAEKGETLKLANENLKTLVDTFNSMQLEHNKVYLVKTLLGGALSSYGVDVETLLTPEENSNEGEDEGSMVENSRKQKHIKNNFIKEELAKDAHSMALCGVFEEKEAKKILSALNGDTDEVSIAEKTTPMTLKQICSSVAVNRDTPLDLREYVITLDKSSEDIAMSFDSKKCTTEKMIGCNFKFPIYIGNDIQLSAFDIESATNGAVSKLYIDNERTFITNKRDLITYIKSYMNENLDVYCEEIIRSK